MKSPIASMILFALATPALGRAYPMKAVCAAPASAAERGVGSPVTAPSAPAPVRVRLSWQTFSAGADGAKRVASLERAIAKMKSLDSAKGSNDPARQKDYMRSWEYWANIHGFFGTASQMNGTVENYVKSLQGQVPQVVIDSFNGLQDQVLPNDGVASKTWGTCQHSHGNVQANFWGWHRIYLYYFERVLRWAANDDTLNLPYWDYTRIAHRALPAPYQDTHSPLFEPKRALPYNAGGQLPAEDTDVNAALVIDDFLKAELTIEQGVHGNVHCDVGGAANGCPQALMGKVPVAGNDPVFYSHHANIDRLWSCWDSLHGAPQPGTWMQESFSFPDETGTLRTRQVSEFLSTEANGYRYEQQTNCLRPMSHSAVHVAAAGAAQLQSGKPSSQITPQKTLGSAPALKLTQSTTQVKLALPRQALLTTGKPAPPVATRLLLGQVSAKVPPGPVVRVYVEVTGHPAVRKLVGTINWFAAFEHEPGPSVQDISFDITDALRSLGVAASALTVTFQASTGVDTTARQPSMQATAPRPPFNPAADLTIGSLQIQQGPLSQ